MKKLDRRDLLRGASAGGAAMALNALFPAWARSGTPGLPDSLSTVSGRDITLTLDRARWPIDGRVGSAMLINGTLPGPIVRLREGQKARLSVVNRLDEEASIHWHGLLVPFQMDGVPGISFPGIAPRSTFVYEFDVKQNGTYWHHSHSAFQEQAGVYGPIVIEPKDPDPVRSDREYVVVLSDYSFMPGRRILEKLKQDSGIFNYQEETIAGLLANKGQTLAERMQWAKMLMDPTDVSDVTGAVYAYLINGHGPKDNWTGLFNPGERVRLRFINAGSQTVFNVRIPGLKMIVVAADGQNVRPVEVDEFQIGNAETYDVVILPTEDRAYTLVAEAADRSGMGRATLAPRLGMTAPVPPLRKRPLDTMKDMGMDMSTMQMGGSGGHAMGAMKMSMLDPQNAPGVKLGPGVQMIAPMPQDRTAEPGQGLESAGHRVLVYSDLVSLAPNPDPRPPTRALEIHLTGNMERFMWGFDGRKFSDNPDPYTFRTGERVRVTLVNDTMMAHPIHLHGHFFEVVQGAPPGQRPLKHTVIVAPGGKVSWDFTANPGDWAFHCHMLYHMEAGMMQAFAVRPLEGSAP
jgi:CopA family copper-resistance protein